MNGRDEQGDFPEEQLKPLGESGEGNKNEYFFFIKAAPPEEIDPVSKGKEAAGAEKNLDESDSFFLPRKRTPESS